MTVNANKIRLGAADSMTLQFGTGPTQYDLGASQGGCVFTYNMTVLQIEIDQSILPLQAFRTKEEVTFGTTLLQIQMNLVNMAFGMAGTSTGVTTTATGTLGTCPAPTVAVVGTGAAVTYTYAVVAFTSNGDGIPSTTATTAVGPTTLSSVNYVNVIHAGNVTGAVGYKVQRTVGGSGAGIIATIYGNQPTGFTLSDTGLTATAYVAAIAQATYPNSDSIKVGGSGAIPSGVFNAAIPKNDGTSNHLRLTMNKVVSFKAIKLDFARDKVSGLSGMELVALADTSQVVGQQGFTMVEES